MHQDIILGEVFYNNWLLHHRGMRLVSREENLEPTLSVCITHKESTSVLKVSKSMLYFSYKKPGESLPCLNQ